MDRRIFFKNMAFSVAGCYLLPGVLKGSTFVQVLPDDLETFFSAPPGEYRPWVLWYWMNGHITKEGLTLDLEMLQRNGFRGAFIYHFNGGIPAGPVKTGSDAWLEMVEHAVREAERLGLEIILEFPSYVVGDQSSVSPAYQFRVFTWSVTELPAGKKNRLKLPMPASDSGIFRDFRVLAYPSGSGVLNPESVLDVTALMNERGMFSWVPPFPGNWKVVRTGWKTAEAPPAIDQMNEESLRLLTENLESLLLPRLSGKSFRGFFTSDRVIQLLYWSQADEAYFCRQEPFNHLPWLLSDVPDTPFKGDTTDRFRHDHRVFVKEKLDNIFFRGMEEWCHRQSLNWYILPDRTISGERGTFWSSQRGMGTKISESGEFPTGVVNGLYDKYDSPWHIRMIADSLFLSGWNQLIISPFFHQPYLTGLPGISSGHPGWAAGRNAVWSEHTADMTRYLGRIGALLRQGRSVTDFVLFTGDLREETFFSDRSYLNGNYSYGYLTPEELPQCAYKEGNIVHSGGQQFPLCLVVPGILLYAASLRRLAELTESGMTLLVISPPQLRLKLSDHEPEISLMAESLFGGWDGVSPMNREFGKGRVVFGRTVGELLQEKNILPDLVITSADEDTNVRFIHRVSGETHFYLLRNNSGHLAQINCSFRSGTHTPELWNPETSRIYTAPIFEYKKGRCLMPLEIPASGVLFVVFRKEPGLSFLKKVTQDGKLLWSNQPFSKDNASPDKPVNDLQPTEGLVAAGQQPFTFGGSKEGVLNALFVQNGIYDFEVNNENVEEHMTVYLSNCFSVPLDSFWKIRFPAGSGAPALYEPLKLESLSASSDFNIRHFSGVCVYETTFYLSDSDFITHRKFILDLGRVVVSARVLLNGKEAGLAWSFPFVSDITSFAKKGENQLMIEVAIPWINRLIGDELLPVENEYAHDGFITKLPDWYVNNLPKPGERKTFGVVRTVGGDTPLQPSGLLGPVRLMFAEERIV